jgi:signal transduction histidine kinase
LGSFRFRLAITLMAVVVGLTAGGSVLAERNAAADAEQALRAEFRGALTALETAREARSAALTARCLALVRKSRIHAALEDDALDLLYLSAHDELFDLMTPAASTAGGPVLHAKFYRFLDARGNVITAPNDETGKLSAQETVRLALPELPAVPQLGYFVRTRSDGAESFDEVITTPIRSTATNRPIAALVVGFAADLAPGGATPTGIRRGLWAEQRLHLPGADAIEQRELSKVLNEALARAPKSSLTSQLDLGGVPHLLLCQRLNAASFYAATYEVSLYSLAASRAQQRRLRLKILSLGGLLILTGLLTTQLVAARLSQPVEKLEAASHANVSRRQLAEESLKSTQVELQRASRFSADASHQLKTPVAVLRAGLQELLVRDDLTAPVREEITTLLKETHQFTGMIEDLLLLSRMEAGRLAIDFSPVDIPLLVASWLDDLSVRPNGEAQPTITSELPATLAIAGERRYTWHILANLLENALRYNRPGGRIRIYAKIHAGLAHIVVGNTGRVVPPESQQNIFERFHRGGASGGVPGHGLGLNLARELAYLHGGDLRLTRSQDDWTEFEAIFRLANAPSPSAD